MNGLSKFDFTKSDGINVTDNTIANNQIEQFVEL